MRKLLLLSILVVLNSCEHDISEPILGSPFLLGFEDKAVYKIILSEPYLYVCAGREGLWRQNIRKESAWEYLGLGDPSLSKTTPLGVMDADISNDDILVAYNQADTHIQPEKSIGIMRSYDGGKSWVRSDAGVPESLVSIYEYNIFTSLKRSPHNPSVVLSTVSPIIYVSTDSGVNWELNFGNRGTILNYGDLRWNPSIPGEAWFFGITATDGTYLFNTKDFGKTYNQNIDLERILGLPGGAVIDDIDFDRFNSNIIYIASATKLIKSTDGGFNWSIQNNGIDFHVYSITTDPRQPNSVFLASGTEIYFSSDNGKSVKSIYKMEGSKIKSLLFDKIEEQLFILTDKGIYMLTLMKTNNFSN